MSSLYIGCEIKSLSTLFPKILSQKILDSLINSTTSFMPTLWSRKLTGKANFQTNLAKEKIANRVD